MDKRPNSDQNDHDIHCTPVSTGCGCNDGSGIAVVISPTTGGQFNVVVRKTDSIDHLKKIISKKLKVLRERICLLYRDRHLVKGTVQENDIRNGSRLILLPLVETGLSTQKPELSVMNALESLNESQVNDFLSGKAPLNLTMRLGDHMMLIQLMLSTFSNPANQMPLLVPSKTSNASSSASSSGSSNISKECKDASASLKKHRLNVEKSPPRTSGSCLEKILNTMTEEISERNSDVDSHTLSRIGVSNNGGAKVVTTASFSSSSYNSDAVPLAKATRNLTQTLQKLSSEVLTSKKIPTVHRKYKNPSNNLMQYTSNKTANAILKNMEHHGRGIYSGTFSGTLNPALQDRFGRPKKDVSTIIHILNDLLCGESRNQQCKSSCNCVSSSEEKLDNMLNKDSHPISFVTNDGVFESIDTAPLNMASPAFLFPPTNVCDLTSLNKFNENQTTRSKMEQLRSMMEERKEKRKEKRFTPYEKPRFPSLNLLSTSSINETAGEPWSPTTTEPSSSLHPTKSTNDPMEATESTNSIHSNPVIA